MASPASPTRSPPMPSSTAPTRLPSPPMASTAGPTNSPLMASSVCPMEPPPMASSAGSTKSSPLRRSASPSNNDPFPNDFELYALPPAKATRFTDKQVKRLNHLVFTLGCVEGRKNNEWAIEEVWMVVPESRGGGADIHLTMAQIIQFIRVWAKQVPEKHLRMAKFYKWVEQQPESKRPWLSERDLATYCKLTFPHMHAKEREVLEQRKISKPDAKKDADTGSQDSAASSIEGSIRVDVTARVVPPVAGNNLNPAETSPSVYLPEASIPLPNTPTTRSRTTASSAKQSPALARLSLPPSGVAHQVVSSGTPTRSRTTGAIAAAPATGPPQAALLPSSIYTPAAARFRATGSIAAEAPASGLQIPSSPPSRFRAVRGVPAETSASGSAQIPSSPPPADYLLAPPHSRTMASIQEPLATIAPFQPTLPAPTVRPVADTPAVTLGAEQVFHLTVRAYTDPIGHLAITPGLVSLFVGNKQGDTIVYTISVMKSQVVEHLMRTPGFTGVRVGPCNGCWTCRQAAIQSD
ncbi:hypothetical protein EV426DRAFT_572503 [Tirmania nivea]|nr:hypothetical protein EV426DRAFT_572503 [Tirmania nivea]